jgi:hypothetical protein
MKPCFINQHFAQFDNFRQIMVPCQENAELLTRLCVKFRLAPSIMICTTPGFIAFESYWLVIVSMRFEYVYRVAVVSVVDVSTIVEQVFSYLMTEGIPVGKVAH